MSQSILGAAAEFERAVGDRKAEQRQLSHPAPAGPLPPSGARTTRDAVYFSQDEAQEEASGDGFIAEDEKRLAPEEVEDFVAKVLDDFGVEDRPAIHFDVPDVHELAAWADAAGLHLHPRLCRPWTVLHELAHWVDVRQGHGPRFCANFLDLIKVHYGLEVATILLRAFERHDVLVDEDTLDDDLWLVSDGGHVS